jgi:hypothetical protein
MPATSVRDLVIYEDDVVIGTHGRGFWILDDITAIRQFPQQWSSFAQIEGRPANPILFRPATTHLVEWNRNSDTPLPPEESGGKNPPDGAPIDYWLPRVGQVVTMEILDSAGTVVRKFSSEDKPIVPDPKELTVMLEWARPPRTLSKAVGAHRFVWDMRSAPAGGRGGLGMAAIWHDTPFGPRGPLVAAGDYKVRMTVDGHVMEQVLTLRADPRK